MHFPCPIGGASYRWLSWYWQRFPTSLLANPEASRGGQEVSTAVSFSLQVLRPVCRQCGRGAGSLHLAAAEEVSTNKLLTHVDVSLQLQMSDAMENLEELVRISGGEGQIFTVDGPLCMKSVQAMFGYDGAQPTKRNFSFV